MVISTTPQEYRVTDPHALTVVPASGGPPVLDVDTLTRTVRLRGRLMLNTRDMGLAHERLDSHMDAYNGTFLEPFTFAVVSDGVAITGTLDRSPTGDLTERFSDGYSTISTPLTIVLIPGSDTAPQKNFVYILQSAKGILVVSTSDWPSAEHIKIAEVIVQTVGTTQTEGGPLVTRFWNDHAQDINNQGHHTHAWQRLRFEHALWKSGVAITWTIDAVPSPDTVHLALTAGRVYQLHLHTFEAKDTTAGDNVHVVNDSVSPYTEITDFASLLTDSAGISMSGRYFNLVVWASISSGSEKEHLFVNLPSGSYNKLSDAIADVSGFTVFDIPSDFRGIAFLVTRITLRHQAAGGGTWTSEQETDLRGQVPNIIAGGGTAAITTEFADNQFKLFDDGDPTKELAFQLSGITTGIVRTVTIPDKDLTLIDTADAIAAVEGEATLTLTGEASIASGKSLSLLTDGSTGGLKLGASADVHLFRGAANRLDLGTGDDLRLVSGDIELVTGKVLDIFNAFGDANPLARYSSDRIEFGAGGAGALDSFLRWGGDGFIFGPDNFVQLEETAAGYVSWDIIVVGESFPRLLFTDDMISWGDGASTPDVSLSRFIANRLDLHDAFRIWGGYSLEIGNAVQPIPKTSLGEDGLEFGPGGPSALDVNLYRNAADELKTDDKFIIGAGLEVTGNSDFGAYYLDIDDIAVPADPGAGIRRLFVDTATGELSVRTNAGATVSLEAASAGVAAHNILDGVVHLDSIAQGVTRGSLIYGNATPNWDELVIGAADTILASDGTDFSWTGSPSLSGTLTVDTINEFTGAAGVDIEGVQLLDAFIEFDEIATPSAPSADKGRLFGAVVETETELFWRRPSAQAANQPQRISRSFAYDTFGRANSSSLGDLESGQAWTEDGGDWEVSSNELKVVSTGADTLVTFPLGYQENLHAEIVLVSRNGSGINNMGFVFRYVDADNYMLLQLRGSASGGNGFLRLSKKVGGGFTTLRSVGLSTALSGISRIIVILNARGPIVTAECYPTESARTGLAANLYSNTEADTWSATLQGGLKTGLRITNTGDTCDFFSVETW